MPNAFKKLLPERIPALAAIFYNALPARMFTLHYQLIANNIALKENAILIDIGTGPGKLPLLIAQRFPKAKIIGIDLSEKMIEIANNSKKKLNYSNIEFTLMDAGKLHFENNSIDMIISTGAMHHWKEPKKIINEIYRVLKAGGEAWIYDGYAQATDEDIKKSIKKIFLGFPTNRIVRWLMSLHGFSHNEYTTTIKNMIQETLFKNCSLEKCGVMMRIKLQKKDSDD